MQLVTESTQISGSLLDHTQTNESEDGCARCGYYNIFWWPWCIFSHVANEKWLVFLNWATRFLRNTFVKA